MRWYQYLAILFLIGYFAVFLLLPMYTVIAEGLRLDYIVEVFRNPVYIQGLINSLFIAICVSILVFIIAIPLAFIADRYDFHGKGLIIAVIFIPLILPPFVGAFGFTQIFGKFGAITRAVVRGRRRRAGRRAGLARARTIRRRLPDRGASSLSNSLSQHDDGIGERRSIVA